MMRAVGFLEDGINQTQVVVEMSTTPKRREGGCEDRICITTPVHYYFLGTGTFSFRYSLGTNQ